MTISTPELLQNFSAYLSNQNLSSVTAKNYLSDIRYFTDWFLQNYSESLHLSLDQQITPTTLNFFHTHLSGNLSLKTANRRLSAIRKFCQFLVDQNYTAVNSATHLPNILTPSYHLLHQIPDYPNARHLEPSPISTPIQQSANRHLSELSSLPAPASSSIPPLPSPISLPTTHYLPIFIVPLLIFIFTFFILILLTPSPQLLTPTN